MATFGKQKLLPQEGKSKKRNNLFYILPILMFILLLVVGIGAIVTFQALNKNIMKNHRQVEKLQKQFDSFQETQFKVRTMFNEDLSTLNKQFKSIVNGFEEIKGLSGKERKLSAEGISSNEKTIEQIKEGVLAMSLEMKNQTHVFKLSNEDIENLRREFADDFANLISFQNETRNELSKLMYRLNNQTYEAIENLTHYYTEEKQQYNNYLTMAMKNFLSFNDSTQHSYNNTLNYSESYYPNITTEKFYEINNRTQRQNSTYNGSNVAFPIILPIARENQTINETDYLYREEDLVDLINQTDTQTNRSNLSGLIVKKAGEIKEFVSGTYNKAFERLRNSFKSKSEIPSEENKEENIEKEEVKENNGTNQVMTKGIGAMRKYIGNAFGNLLEKLNLKNQQENPSIEFNETVTSGNSSLYNEQETQNDTSISHDELQKYSQEIEMIVVKMMNIVGEMKERRELKEEEFEYEKQRVLSFEHMFEYLEYLLGKYSEFAENNTSLKEWRRNYSLCREVYEGFRGVLAKEENQIQSQKMPQKQFLKRIQKFFAKLIRVKGFPGF